MALIVARQMMKWRHVVGIGHWIRVGGIEIVWFFPRAINGADEEWLVGSGVDGLVGRWTKKGWCRWSCSGFVSLPPHGSGADADSIGV